MSQRCSIIVVTLNEARHLPRLGQALARLRIPDGLALETILVDGGSSDGTPDIARQLGFTKVIALPGASIPVCRNRGLTEASGEWIAFLDGDCEPTPEWLEIAAKYLLCSSARIIGWPVEPPQPGTWVQRAWHAHWLHKNPAASSREPVRQDAFRLITTRNMLMTRTVLNHIPSFDEQLVTGEDTDFVFRAQTQGVEVMAVPDLRVIHHGEPATLWDFFRQQLWHANRSSYHKIVRVTGGTVGGNVILFTLSFTVAALLGMIGLIAAVAGATFTWLFLLVPLALVLVLPAVVICIRAKSFDLLAPLVALYAAYGLARFLDLFGVSRRKLSWKLSES